jgi:hypothetical protein
MDRGSQPTMYTLSQRIQAYAYNKESSNIAYRMKLRMYGGSQIWMPQGSQTYYVGRQEQKLCDRQSSRPEISKYLSGRVVIQRDRVTRSYLHRSCTVYVVQPKVRICDARLLENFCSTFNFVLAIEAIYATRTKYLPVSIYLFLL